jgi:hypothetical protein
MRHLESFGKLDLYLETISLVKHDRNLWRKVANILNNLRNQLRVWPHIAMENQVASAKQYLGKALVDTKMSEPVREALKIGINREFGFQFEK